MLRSKRQKYEFCKLLAELTEDLTKCPGSQWVTKCIPESEYVICSNSQVQFQAGKCMTEISNYRCCVVDCP